MVFIKAFRVKLILSATFCQVKPLRPRLAWAGTKSRAELTGQQGTDSPFNRIVLLIGIIDFGSFATLIVTVKSMLCIIYKDSLLVYNISELGLPLP